MSTFEKINNKKTFFVSTFLDWYKLDTIGAKKKTESSIISRKQDYEIKKIKEQNAIKNPFSKMHQFKRDTLITSFNEEAVYAFYEAGIISRKDQKHKNNSEKEAKEIRDILKMMLFYYSQDNRGNNIYSTESIYFHSVIGEVRRYLDHLRTNKEESPIDFWNARQNIADPCYSHANVSMPNPITTEMNKQLIREYESYNGSINTVDSQFLEKWQRYQSIYTSYGFPFLFVLRNKSCEDVREYYLGKVCKIMEELQEKQHSLSSGEYKEYISTVKKDITNRIPILLERENLTVQENKLKGMEKTVFLDTLTKRLEKVRPYRNDIAHKNNKISSEEKEKIAKEICEWIKEYEQLVD